MHDFSTFKMASNTANDLCECVSESEIRKWKACADLEVKDKIKFWREKLKYSEEEVHERANNESEDYVDISMCRGRLINEIDDTHCRLMSLSRSTDIILRNAAEFKAFPFRDGPRDYLNFIEEKMAEVCYDFRRLNKSMEELEEIVECMRDQRGYNPWRKWIEENPIATSSASASSEPIIIPTTTRGTKRKH
jgi:hypothetical protein